MSWLTGVPRRFEEKSNPKGVNQYSGAGGAGGAGGGKGKGAQRMERLRGKTVFTALSGMADAERGVGEVVQKLNLIMTSAPKCCLVILKKDSSP